MHRRRFRTALERVLDEKKLAFAIPVTAEIMDRVFDEVKPPFFRRMYQWILENWETIFKLLVVIVPMFL
jgi:hypothetical protein